MNFTDYVPRNVATQAVQIESRPTRMHMTSSVYDYKGHSFVGVGMPVVGDYLVKKGNALVHMSKANFEAQYKLQADG